jgi:hypothetical protein
MHLNHGLHLTYCTNVHRGETWAETSAALENSTLAVRDRVCPGRPFGIGLRLSARAARELGDPTTLLTFRRWLDRHQCYVFTVNGFSFGAFHGERVKERVFLPDWTTPERLDYTNLLLDLLSRLVPAGIEGSVSTAPGSFKGTVTTAEELKLIRDNVWRCVEHAARVSEQTGRKLHLGLEPEPLGVLENSREVLIFFDRLRVEHRNDARLAEHLGVTYDTCHFAVAFEEPHSALASLRQHGIRISKLHLSNALKVRATPETLAALGAFADDVYLHQVAFRTASGKLKIYPDLPQALAHEAHLFDDGAEAGAEAAAPGVLPFGPHSPPGAEWRIHFHIPLHAPATPLFNHTADHLLGALDALAAAPKLCSHLEMETYTWDVLPPELKGRSVVEQLVAEYGWTLARLAERGLAARG